VAYDVKPYSIQRRTTHRAFNAHAAPTSAAPAAVCTKFHSLARRLCAPCSFVTSDRNRRDGSPTTPSHDIVALWRTDYLIRMSGSSIGPLRTHSTTALRRDIVTETTKTPLRVPFGAHTLPKFLAPEQNAMRSIRALRNRGSPQDLMSYANMKTALNSTLLNPISIY
jgi:hypothetical protein